MKQKCQKNKNFWNYYIKGKYHCDKCPFCWGGEYLPACDDYEDTGCYIKGELRESCRLLPPFRFLIGWLFIKKAQYYDNHKYDNMGDWYEKQYEEEQKFEKVLEDYLHRIGGDIIPIDINGNLIKDESVPLNTDEKPAETPEDSKDRYLRFNKEFNRFPDLYSFYYDCKDLFSPFEPKSLKKEWKKTIKNTWHSFIMIFKPYFCK